MRAAIIPARGGSVRVPFKNGREFHGRPMLAYPIQAARESGLFDLIAVSTDDQTLADIAFRNGAVVVPREADDGTTGTQEIAARVLDHLDLQGSCCVIYPCTPLLTPEDLRGGYRRLLQSDARCFVGAVREWKTEHGTCWEDAGAFYWGWTRAFRDRKPLDEFNTAKYALPAERVIDINTHEDWALAESMFAALRRAS